EHTRPIAVLRSTFLKICTLLRRQFTPGPATFNKSPSCGLKESCRKPRAHKRCHRGWIRGQESNRLAKRIGRLNRSRQLLFFQFTTSRIERTDSFLLFLSFYCSTIGL